MFKLIETTEAFEKKLLSACDDAQKLSILSERLKDAGLDVKRADVEWMLGAVMKLLVEKYDDPLLVRGFRTRKTTDGSLRLGSYYQRQVSLSFDADEQGRVSAPAKDHIWIQATVKNCSPCGPDVIVPDCISELAPGCFSGRAGVRSVAIPNGVTVVPQNAFSKCADLEEVILPDSVKVIEGGAFIGCAKLHTVNLPPSLAEIGNLSFYGCERLVEIELPASLERVGYGAFARCAGLTTLRTPGGFAVPREYHAFFGCDRLDQTAVQHHPLTEDAGPLLRSLEQTVSLFLDTFVTRGGINYNFYIDEIEPPADGQIAEMVSEAEWQADIHHYLSHSNWVLLVENASIKDRLERGDSGFLESAIVDTFKHLRAEIYQPEDDVLPEYEAEYKSIDLISMRFLHIGGKWYVMLFDWCD